MVIMHEQERAGTPVMFAHFCWSVLCPKISVTYTLFRNVVMYICLGGYNFPRFTVDMPVSKKSFL